MINNSQVSAVGDLQRALVLVGRSGGGRPPLHFTEQQSKAFDLARHANDDDDGRGRLDHRQGTVPAGRPAPLQPAAILRGLGRERRLLHGVGTVARGA